MDISYSHGLNFFLSCMIVMDKITSFKDIVLLSVFVMDDEANNMINVIVRIIVVVS
jgi:hypothetical protein